MTRVVLAVIRFILSLSATAAPAVIFILLLGVPERALIVALAAPIAIVPVALKYWFGAVGALASTFALACALLFLTYRFVVGDDEPFEALKLAVPYILAGCALLTLGMAFDALVIERCWRWVGLKSGARAPD
ncbi:MAG: hypothetical protein ACR652_20735 [Methylocystis sp.]|uniref:hypothetical protein n=1 Tax=Methylocystis sp. TaxID=1911079 RepID=UPI003DA2B31C